MIEGKLLEQAKHSIKGLGKKRALLRVEELAEGIQFSIFDTQDKEERLIVLDNHPFLVSDWSTAEKLLLLLMGFRRRSDKQKRRYCVERIPLEHKHISGEE